MNVQDRAVRGRTAALALVAAVSAALALAPAAAADEYTLTEKIIDRAPDAYHRAPTKAAYKGPKVWVQGQSVNRDYYSCAPGAGDLYRWVLVADDLATTNLSFLTQGIIVGGYLDVSTWNFSDTTAHVRVVLMCNQDPDNFDQASYGSYDSYNGPWIASLWAGTPDFRCLAVHAFGWFDTPCGGAGAARAAAARPLAPVIPAALPRGNTFPLRNGSNTLALSFRQPRRSPHPPAIYLSTSPAGADCVSRRLHVPINNQYGYLHFVLRCKGLRPGATAKLRIGPSIRRSFPLREGIGRGRVRLDKPPGRVEPLVYVGTRPARTPCRILSRRTRMARRTVHLRLTSHCHHVARGARGELSVGGLLAENPR